MFTHNNRMLKTSLVLMLSALILVFPLSIVFAAAPTGVAGQPNQSCETAGVTPGYAAGAPGSAFNPGGVAGSVYAGEQPQNSVNPLSVSQYDVACYQLSIH